VTARATARLETRRVTPAGATGSADREAREERSASRSPFQTIGEIAGAGPRAHLQLLGRERLELHAALTLRHLGRRKSRARRSMASHAGGELLEVKRISQPKKRDGRYHAHESRQKSVCFYFSTSATDGSRSPPRDHASPVMRGNRDARSFLTLHACFLMAWLPCAFVGVAANGPALSDCSGTVDASTTPEAARCSTIAGSLVVTGRLHPAFTDAAALANHIDDPIGDPSSDPSSDPSDPSDQRTPKDVVVRVEGDVVVAPGAEETSLRGAFPELTHVGGSVVLVQTNLVILAVFPKLTRVVGDVRIEQNERALRLGDDAFAAFPSLAEIGGALVVERNDVLEQFEGFEALRTVGGGVRIANNAGLRRIAPLVRDVKRAIPHWVGALPNSKRSRTSRPFPALTRVVGSLVLETNGALEGISDAFPSLREIRDGDVVIRNETSLRAIERSFTSLDEITSGSLSIAECASLASIDGAFARARSVGKDLTLSRLETLRFVRGGSFTRISAVGGSVTVRNTALESVSFLLSLGVVNGDLNVGEGCPDLASLDGLQNLRRVAGATRVAPASLRGNFGRCGAVSSDRGVTHTCYARGFRVCVPLFPTRGNENENENDASFESIGATPRARATTVPGWYRCVDTLATALVETPELRTSAAVFAAAGLMDALHAPRADVTLFAPTDVAWLRNVGRVGDVLARAGAGPAGKNGVRAVALAHVVAGTRRLFSIKDGHVLRSVAATSERDVSNKPTVTEYAEYAEEIPNVVVGLRASVKFGAFFKTAPALKTRCAAMPGLSEACAPRPTRAVALEPHAVSRDVNSLAHDTVLPNDSERFSAVENVLARFDADAGRFADASASAETSGFGDAAAETPQLASRAALGLDPSHAVVVLGDLVCANGIAHVVDAPLAPHDFFAPAPTRQDPPSFSQNFPTHDAQSASIPVFLQTPPPPAPAATSAPPPALMPVAAYFTAPPPPPTAAGPPPSPPLSSTSSSPPAPPGGAGVSGSCAARAPDICGMCDYTFSETDGVCCCDESCVASGDCCADYQAVCVRAR